MQRSQERLEINNNNKRIIKMKIESQFKRKPLASWIAMSLVSASVIGMNTYAAAPLAGTEIKNLATVSYEDENGNTYTAQSNEAVITVAPQYRATLENDRTQSAAPGQTAYFPHTLVNTGNTPDTYTLGATNNATIYLDSNGNGQPDAGENPVNTVTLGAGETAQLIVAYAVPANAADGTSESIVLTATSSDANGIVKDTGLNGDADADNNNATNNDVVDITTGPVLVLNKSAVIDTQNNRVTYTLRVKNTGGSDAKLVDIIDAVPTVDHDNNAGTPSVPLTNINIDELNGFQDAADVLPATLIPAALVQVDETTVGVDLNDNGTSNDVAVDVIKVTDAVLAPNTTVSIVYSADYDPAWSAGSSIDNTFITQADDDGVPGGAKTTTTSNTTHDEIPQTFAVIADDDGKFTPSAGINDGNDDGDNNGTTNVADEQSVDKIAAGDTVIFTHTVKNTGNGEDTFNLTVADTDFPAGTVFTLWNADGTVQLTDSDSDNIPDTGNLAQNETATIVVKAILPASASGNAGYHAVLTATSSTDPTVNDTTNLKLSEITAPAVDVAAITPAAGTYQNNDGFNDGGAVNAHDEFPVLFANDAALGSTVSFPMSIANESGSSDSFLLTYNDLPAGWSVVFKDSSGATITATPFLPAGSTFDYTAYVTVSSDPTLAQGDSPRQNDVDGYDGVNDEIANLTATDTDKDYVIEFVVTSASDATRTDSIKHAVDVKTVAAVSITPDGQNQIQPGGTVEYPHKLVNNGNINEAVEVASSNSDATWNSTTLIDTSGNGIGDTELSSLAAGMTIKAYQSDGTLVNIVLSDTDGDGLVEFPLAPGQYVKLTNKVFAPANAPQGAVNATELTAQDPGGVVPTIRTTATDTSNVILGQVRLDKTVARQSDCNDLNTIGGFDKIQPEQVEPGQCVVWQIVAKNEGDALVKNVVIKDNVPAYTSALANSLKYCKGFGCVPLGGISDAVGDDAAEIANELVTFFVGDNPTPASSLGGQLLPGESATVRFTVKVDE